MLYLRIDNKDESVTFHLLKENNIYIQCEECGNMVLVDDPINFIVDMADMGLIMDYAFDRCEKRSKEYFDWEEEICRNRWMEKIENSR